MKVGPAASLFTSPTGRFWNFFENSRGTDSGCFATISLNISSVEPKDFKAGGKNTWPKKELPSACSTDQRLSLLEPTSSPQVVRLSFGVQGGPTQSEACARQSQGRLSPLRPSFKPGSESRQRRGGLRSIVDLFRRRRQFLW